MATLSPRQQREIDYHRDYARARADERMGPVDFDVIEPGPRRWDNAYWLLYSLLLRHDLKGKRVLAPGCGFGEDAARLSRLGAEVHGFDISPDIVALASERMRRHGYSNIHLSVMACEALDFESDTFDVVVLVDILHHVDILQSVAEIRRVLKPGGRIVGDELYTHSFLQKNIRESWPVRKVIYPAMKPFIYGRREAYITEDEHKIDETEFASVEAACSDIEVQYFNALVGRLVPDRWPVVEKLDRAFIRAMGGAGRFLAGRVVFDGAVAKSP